MTGEAASNGIPGTIRIGIQPTCWTNDDFQEIGDGTPYQVILDEMQACGYDGGSTGHNYPSHLPSLKYELASRSLSVTSTWLGTHFTTEGQYDATLDALRGQIRLLKSLGANDIVVAELASAVNQIRTKAVLSDRPILNGAQWYLLLQGLNEAGRMANSEGMRLCFHPHVGTGVQDLDEIRRLMRGTDPSLVHMCLDTGHAYFAGVDPRGLTNEFLGRIAHVHLKNVRDCVRERAVAECYSFFQAIREGIFTVPGDPAGAIDFEPILDALKPCYAGWIVVEAEQDPRAAHPATYADMARQYIRSRIGV